MFLGRGRFHSFMNVVRRIVGINESTGHQKKKTSFWMSSFLFPMGITPMKSITLLPLQDTTTGNTLEGTAFYSYPHRQLTLIIIFFDSLNQRFY